MLDVLSENVLLYALNLRTKYNFLYHDHITFHDEDVAALDTTPDKLILVCESLKADGYFESVHISHDNLPKIILSYKAYTYIEFKQFEEAQLLKEQQTAESNKKIQKQNKIHQWINSGLAFLSVLAAVLELLLK